jgi:hypothetical protein
MVEDIWDGEVGMALNEMSKKQCNAFLLGFVRKNNPTMEVSSAAMDQFFRELDVNGNGKVSKAELGAFLLKFTSA